MSFKYIGMNKYALIFFYTLFILVIPSVSFALILGPYTGTVIDSRTGEPIEKATVLIYWMKLIPAPPSGGRSELIGSTLVYTDNKGKYFIPPYFANTGLAGVLEYTSVVIYQPGYQAHIVRIWHQSHKETNDFPKLNNTVKLDRIPPVFSHGQHYENIEHALWGLDTDDEATLHREVLLRRAGWEERRGRSEEKE
jgi:hypothetical protein